jgi:hypothetical protein
MLSLIVCGAVAVSLLVYLARWGKKGTPTGGRAPRIPFTVPVEVHTNPGHRFRGASLDISEGGMLVRVAAMLSVAQPVQLSFTLPESADVFIPAVVCHCRGELVGVRFDPTHHKRVAIEKWVKAAIEEKRTQEANA